jgi:membrane protein DedA with SNARE-associated domain
MLRRRGGIVVIGADDRLNLPAVQHFLSDSGYAALVVLAFAEGCCVPFPSEITFGFAGFLAASGRLNLAAVIFIGTFAEFAGSLVGYTIGRVGGRPLVKRFGRYVLLTNADLDRAERWLSGRGEYSVAIGRALPLVRTFISLVAGTAEMPWLKFAVFSLAGTLVWSSALASIGYAVSGTWHKVAHGFSIAGYVLAVLVVLTLAWLVAHRLRQLRHERSLLAAKSETTSI